MVLVKRLGYKDTYSYSFIVIVTLVMMSVSVGVNYLYGNTMMRLYVLIGFSLGLIIVAVKKRVLIVKMVRMIL